MGELGGERTMLPTKKQRGHFVQTDRAAHEAWGRLAVKSPAAGALLHVLVANVGEQNAIVASHKVAWTEGRDKLRYSRLQAEVLVSEDEQPAGVLDAVKEELHRLPRVGELQLPSGQGLPPVSQPSFPGLEPDLPAFGHTANDNE